MTLRVTGTTDPAEIAAALAALTAAGPSDRQPTGYDRWRRDRIRALRQDIDRNRYSRT